MKMSREEWLVIIFLFALFWFWNVKLSYDVTKLKNKLCNKCKLRIKFPSYIDTTSKMKEHIENKSKEKPKKYNKFENIYV